MKGREWSLWIGIELCSTKPDGVIRGTSQHEKVGHPKQDRYPGGLEERANPLDPLLKALDNRAESIALATYRRKFAHSELNRTQRNAPAVSIIMKITLSSVFSVLFWVFLPEWKMFVLNVGVWLVADVESKCERLIPDEEVNKLLPRL